MFIFQPAGVAALGSNYIAVGIHTGTILLFCIRTTTAPGLVQPANPSRLGGGQEGAAADTSIPGTSEFRCENIDSQRCHVYPITDLASTSTSCEETKEVKTSKIK